MERLKQHRYESSVGDLNLGELGQLSSFTRIVQPGDAGDQLLLENGVDNLLLENGSNLLLVEAS